jgi:putative peptidoglycan lipid II flippase
VPRSSRTPRPLQAALLLSGAFLLSRITGLLQLTVINALLPAEYAAAYIAAFTLPDVVNYLVAGGAMSVTFIPIFTQLRHDAGGDNREAWRFFSTVATLMGVVLFAIVALCTHFAQPLVALTAPGLLEPGKERTFEAAVQMTRVMLPAQLFFYLGGMVVGVLNAHKRFGASAFTSVVYNVVALALGLVLWLAMGEIGFAWGILVGAFCGNFLLPLGASLLGPREERVRFRPSLDVRAPGVRLFFLNALPIMLGVSLPVIDQVVVRFFASSLEVDALRNLGTANRFMLAPLGIVAQAASVAAFPYLAADSAAQDWAKFSDFLRSGLRRLMFVTLPLTALLVLTAHPILRLFAFANFSSADANATATVFALYCLGIFAWSGQQLAARGFYALQDTKTPTIIGSLLAILFFVPLCALVVRLGWGANGLALATSIGALAQFACVTGALNARLRQARYGAPLKVERVMGTILRTLAACIPMLAVGFGAVQLCNALLPATKAGDIARIILISALSLPAFGWAATLFRIPEWLWLRDKALSRLRRR